MLPSPTLFVTDLDGTLLTTQKTVSPRTRAAIAAVRAEGIRTAVASARPFRLVEDVLGRDLGLFDALIVSNGAAVFDPSSHAVLHETTLEPGDARRLIDALRARFPDAGFGWEYGDRFAGDARFRELVAAGGILRDPSSADVAELPGAGIHQLVLSVRGVSPRSMIDDVALLVGDDHAVTDSNGGVLEISSARATKADGARWWAESLGRGLQDAIAFGDEHNDIPLLMSVGRGYAMAAAAEDVKRAAAGVAGGNDEDGVAIVLEELVARLAALPGRIEGSR